MKNIPRWVWLPVAAACVAVVAIRGARPVPAVSLPATLLRHSHVVKTIAGVSFRDLNKNGRLDIYEDVRQPVEKRIR
ncbi:MAG TPA: hypothetical protein VGC22_00655, partial [Chitinophaga sp.]